MKTAILVHSMTGNTLYVAQKLKDQLQAKGHEVALEKLEPVGGEDKNMVDPTKIVLRPVLDLQGFDNVVLAGPVRGFSMSPVLKAYVSQVESLKGRKMILFVTHFFPFSFLGGESAIRQMRAAVEAKGAQVVATGIVDWKGFGREKKINRLVEDLATRF